MKFKRGGGFLVPPDPKMKVALPPDLYGELQEIANRHKLSVIQLLIKIIKCGLLMVYVEENHKDGARIFIRDNEGEREIKVFDERGENHE